MLKKVTLKISRILLVVFLLAASWQVRAAIDIQYQASYKGVFSLFRTMTIADVNYSVSSHEPELSPKYRQIRLWVTSEKHSTVERLYPFRYLYKSFFNADSDQTQVFENIKITKKKEKLRHQVGLLDFDKKKIQLYASSHKNENVLPDVVAGITRTEQQQQLQKRFKLKKKAPPLIELRIMPIDRLSMLELMAEQVTVNQIEKIYRITNGDELFDYRVTLGQSQKLSIAGQKKQARKVKIEAFELTASGEPVMEMRGQVEQLQAAETEQRKYAHAPVYAWFSEIDGQQTAVKFLNRHAIGDFVVEMVNGKQK
jgi:hypothetical protein